jgi:hypothetical protein
MSENRSTDDTPRRFRTLRFNPLREMLPWVAIVVGIVQTARAGTGAIDPIFTMLGLVLIVVGGSGFFVGRWLEKRNL